MMNIADALSGHAKLEGIQWLLRAGAPRRALRRELSALLPTPDMLGSCQLRYARLEPGRKLTAYYNAQVRVARGHSPRPIAVTWTSDGDANGRQGTSSLVEIQAEAVRHGVAAPFRQLTADVPAWGMHVQVWPLDARFPQLVRLADPRYARDLFASAYAANGVPRDQALDSFDVTSIRYRPGKRHVLRYDSLDTAERETIFAKVSPSDKGERVFRVATQVAEWLVEHGEGVTSVRPLAYVAEDAVVLYPRVFGAPLSERLRRRGQGVVRCLERAGVALHAMHQVPQGVAGPLQPHDFATEVKKAARASNHIPALLPSVGAAIQALLERAREVHERLPQEPPTLTHGDFKCEHLWVAPGELTLIDFDSCRLADPAFDVGRFLADLQLWFAAYDQPGLEEAQESFLVGYARGAPEERLVRARLYEAVQLVKMARRVPLFSHGWASRTEEVLRRAQAVLNDLELTLGLPVMQPSLPRLLERARG